MSTMAHYFAQMEKSPSWSGEQLRRKGNGNCVMQRGLTILHWTSSAYRSPEKGATATMVLIPRLLSQLKLELVDLLLVSRWCNLEVGNCNPLPTKTSIYWSTNIPNMLIKFCIVDLQHIVYVQTKCSCCNLDFNLHGEAHSSDCVAL